MSHRTCIWIATSFVAVVPLFLATPTPAQEAHEGDEREVAAPEPDATSRFSGIIQADFTNAYVFRGIMQERDGFIAQPWGELYVNLFSSEDGPIRDVTIGGGVWASFQTENTLAVNNPRSLYETDWYPLLSVELPWGITWTSTYYFYTSPNDAFRTVQELNFKLAWDDSETLGRLSLQPWVNFAVETKRTSFGGKEGSGVQFGVAPTLYEFEHDRYPVTFTAPLEMGLAIDDYYEEEDGSEDNFGYVSFGVIASMPLAFVPEVAGAWTLSLSGKGYSLSDTLTDANRGDRWWPVGMLSVSVEL